jgi:hypothetical protein
MNEIRLGVNLTPDEAVYGITLVYLKALESRKNYDYSEWDRAIDCCMETIKGMRVDGRHYEV